MTEFCGQQIYIATDNGLHIFLFCSQSDKKSDLPISTKHRDTGLTFSKLGVTFDWRETAPHFGRNY